VAGTTVIDQLIIKLGLDPRDFTKGEKQVAASVINTEKQVKKSSEGMGRSFVGFAGKLLGVATAVALVKKVAGAISDLSTTIRQLGIDSKNLDTSAAKLRNWQNAAEMMGGKGDDVTKTVANLEKAVFDLAYNGQISDSLVMLARLGVQFQTATGQARKFEDVVFDTAKALESSNMSRNAKYNFLQQSGFDEGTINLILSGTKAMKEQLALQEKRRQVTDKEIAAATKWEQSATNRDQAVAAGGLAALPAAAAAGTKANDLIAAGAELATGQRTLASTTAAVNKKFVGFMGTLERWANEATAKARRMNGKQYKRSDFDRTINDAAEANGIPPEVLSGLLRTESNFDPYAYNEKSGATGIAQLLPKYFPNAGKDPHADIRTAAKHLADLRDDFSADGEDMDTALQSALQAYNAGRARVLQSRKEGGKPLAAETQDYTGKVMRDIVASPPPATPGAQGASNYTKVDIDQININTQATDADGIAADADAAVKRKLMASHAEAGVQ